MMEKTSEKKKIGGQVIGIESRASGRVNTKVYWAYMTAAGGCLTVTLMFISMILRTGGDIGSSRWLAYWSDEVGAERGDDTGFYLGIYAGLSIVTNLFILFSLVVLVWGQLR